MAVRNKQTAGRWKAAAGVYILVFCLVSLCFLERFPFVHSDESWLAGLSRGMLKTGSIGATEPFFDLKPRYPHAIKTLFHLLQMGMISAFGYDPAAVRLLSWAGGAAALWFCFLAGSRFLGSEKKGFFLMALFSADIQFLYASHFARQEILLCLVQWACLWVLFSPGGFYHPKGALALGLCTGLSVGLHPNSFLVGAMNGLCLLCGAAGARRRAKTAGAAPPAQKAGDNPPAQKTGGDPAAKAAPPAPLTQKTGSDPAAKAAPPAQGAAPLKTAWWAPLGLYLLTAGGLAAGFVALSYRLDSQFLQHYFANGAREFGIDAGGWEKLLGFFGFLKRLYQQNSGTYYLPDIRFQFFLFGAGLLMAAVLCAAMKKELPQLAQKLKLLLAGLAGVAAGMVLIGRYNQTSVLFLFPFGYLAAAMALELFEGRIKKGLGALLLAAVLSLTVFQVRGELQKGDYRAYEQQLTALIPAGARVLGNLNMEFFLEYDCLRDYRNLPYALEGEGLEAYLEADGIEYIVYHQELDYLWEHRPYYNVIYGNVQFVQQLKEYCEQNCQLVGSFEDPWYGIRVAQLRGQQAYARVTVYKRDCSSVFLG